MDSQRGQKSGQGAMQGGLSGAATGAMAGMAGGPPGMIAGALIGGLLGSTMGGASGALTPPGQQQSMNFGQIPMPPKMGQQNQPQPTPQAAQPMMDPNALIVDTSGPPQMPQMGEGWSFQMPTPEDLKWLQMRGWGY